MATKALQSLLLPAPRLNQLYVMQQIAANPHVTQAELAQNCSLSVAMVNNYMKELCASGLVEYQRKSSKSISYHLTDAGKASLAEMGQEYMHTLVALFNEAKTRIRRVILEQGGEKIRRVVLYGSGDMVELAFHALESADIAVIGICSNGEEGQAEDCCGRELMNPNQIRFVDPDAIVIASHPEYADKIFESLVPLQERGIRLIRLDIANCEQALSMPGAQLAPMQIPLIGHLL
jgi:predicted transcriptional regulator